MHQCYLCGLIYSHRQNLNRHMRITHNLKNACARFDCCLCGHIFTRKKAAILHFTSDHQINIVTEEYNFHSIEQFTLWKAEYEKKNAVRYILKCGSKLKTIGKVYYSCHRSGYFQSKSKGNRHLKIQGSQKIGGYCPSSMVVTRRNDGTCKLVFVTTHVGHKNELAHIKLTQSERRAIAEKIADKVPFNAILEEVRDSVSSPKELERIHLLTRKDLHNIGKCFKLTPNIDSGSSGDTVDTWVRERLCSPNNCILLHKAQGETCDDYQNLNKEDFVLGIMNSVQENMLRSYGKETVCVDTTPKACFFAMTTVSVIDDEGVAYPCAFLFSNRSDKEVLKLFFQKIETRLGKVSASAFQGDISDTAYTAWLDIMGKPSRRELSSWVVEEVWHRQLKKIRPQEKRQKTLVLLESLLRHEDKNSFCEQLEGAVNALLRDPDVAVFSCLFHKQFLTKFEQWALCYRTQNGLKGNKALEELHKRLEQIYSQAKRTNRMDRAIHGAMRLLTERIVGKSKIAVAQVNEAHEETGAHETEDVSPPQPPCSSCVFTVSLDQEPCTIEVECATRKSCIHRYRCTCPEWKEKNSICKHIHIVSQLAAKAEKTRTAASATEGSSQEQLVEPKPEAEGREEEEEQQPDHEEQEVEEAESGHMYEAYQTAVKVDVGAGEGDLAERKARLRLKIEVLLRAIDTSESSEDLSIIERLLAPATLALLQV